MPADCQRSEAARGSSGAKDARSSIANRRIVDMEVRNGKGSGINGLQGAGRRGLTLLKAITGCC